MDLDLVELNQWLEGFMQAGPERETKLRTTEVMCEEFGHPERCCPCLHVAGSKGKGTIVANAAAMLTEAGYRVGMYVSPHVRHFTERVSLNGEPFGAEVYEAAYRELRTGVERMITEGKLKREMITWTELVTVFGMLCFREAKVDYAVYEVGMGGRLDPTNVVRPECVMMGLIELEHTKYLGDSLEKIAAEKAGIFKEGVPVVSVMQETEVMKVFLKFAKEKGAEMTYVSAKTYYEEDAMVAMEAVKKVVPGMSEEMFSRAMRKARLPGRYERVGKVLMDGAHTVKSIEAVTKRMKEEGVSGNLLFGCAADKNVEKMAEVIYQSGMFKKVFLTRPGDFKKADLSRMEKAFRTAGFSGVEVDSDFEKIIRKATSQEGDLVVLGSFYLVGEVEKALDL